MSVRVTAVKCHAVAVSRLTAHGRAGRDDGACGIHTYMSSCVGRALDVEPLFQTALTMIQSAAEMH